MFTQEPTVYKLNGGGGYTETPNKFMFDLAQTRADGLCLIEYSDRPVEHCRD
jgi:hypothetical protein